MPRNHYGKLCTKYLLVLPQILEKKTDSFLFHHFFVSEQLDATFINFLFDGIESPLPCDPELVTPQYFLECLLALNLHYAGIESGSFPQALKFF